MKYMSGNEIRKRFLKFFEDRGHLVLPSASLIPQDDPTLLLIGAGMAPFKPFFTGKMKPPSPRITTCQKCVRTGDIENVGRTARHHTYFEMLGDFSFGDYFKKEIIPWSWEFLTKELELPADKLWVTIHPTDDEAYEIWHNVVGVPDERIVRLEENFWETGSGPCGPDSELHIDMGEERGCGRPDCKPGCDCDRFLEIWNLVFTQYDQHEDGTYTPLANKNIDTGAGLERLASVLQGKPSNFETDLIFPIIEYAAKVAGVEYGKDKKTDVSLKVIADHVRSITFMIADGVLPSNEGRGYVIRRLIRRAELHGQKLGIDGAFLYKLVPVVGDIMKSAYPEVLEQAEFIQKVIKMEEERFNNTLKDGMQLLDQVIADAKENKQDKIDGKTAFKLYDTYGFPLELTVEYANDAGLGVNEDEFQSEMDAQKERARNARSNEKSMGVQNGLLTDIKTPSEYVGYEKLDAQGVLKDIIVDNQLVDEVADGEAKMIFSVTPFYAEMGGQVADQGVIKDENGEVVAEVEDVQHAPNGQNMHTVKVLKKMTKEHEYELVVNKKFHDKVRKNHTATHLLDQALRDVLGEHTHQAGSLVEPTYLRFDFTNLGSVTAEDLDKVERIVNEKIWDALPVETVETDIESAKKMGAIALFSEKYGDVVRVVKIGDYSMEFCGGNHADNTSELGLFKIVSESGVGAGVRRIEAVTSKEAYEFLQQRNNILNESAAKLKVAQVKDVPSKIDQTLAQIKELEQQKQALEDKFASQQAADVFKNVQTINGKTLIASQVNVSGMNQLRQLADQWKAKDLSDVLVLGTATEDGKVNLVVAMSDAAMKDGLKAGDLIKEIAPLVGGGGGGRPNLAQAGGKKPAGMQDALKAAAEWLAKK